MEAAVGFFFMVVVMSLILFVVGLMYKNRLTIAKWLNDPAMCFPMKNREAVLKRHIEDAQKELAELEAKKESR